MWLILINIQCKYCGFSQITILFEKGRSFGIPSMSEHFSCRACKGKWKVEIPSGFRPFTAYELSKYSAGNQFDHFYLGKCIISKCYKTKKTYMVFKNKDIPNISFEVQGFPWNRPMKHLGCGGNIAASTIVPLKDIKILFTSDEITASPDDIVVTVDREKTKRYKKNGILHRIGGPAIEFSNGEKHYYQDGILHREDGPAIEGTTQAKAYYFKGRLHREDGPAIINISGLNEWYLHGKRHRVDGPAVDHGDGYGIWYFNGLEHREDGPSSKYKNGYECWKKKGEFHRIGGPAIIHGNGLEDWYINGQKVNSHGQKTLLRRPLTVINFSEFTKQKLGLPTDKDLVEIEDD